MSKPQIGCTEADDKMNLSNFGSGKPNNDISAELGWMEDEIDVDLINLVLSDVEDQNVDDDPKLRDFLETGKNHIRKKRWVEAVNVLTEGILEFPKKPACYIYRNLSLIKLSRFYLAETDCSLALDLRPDYDKAYLHRALARKCQGKFIDASFDLLRVIDLHPDLGEPFTPIRNEYDFVISQAIDEFGKSSIRIDFWEEKRQLSVREKNFGTDFLKKGFCLAAASKYTNAIQLVSKDPTFYANLAICWIGLGNFNNAESDCTKALALDKKYLKVRIRRARIRKCVGDLKGARDDLGEAFLLSPKDSLITKEFEETVALIKRGNISRKSYPEENIRSNFVAMREGEIQTQLADGQIKAVMSFRESNDFPSGGKPALENVMKTHFIEDPFVKELTCDESVAKTKQSEADEVMLEDSILRSGSIVGREDDHIDCIVAGNHDTCGILKSHVIETLGVKILRNSDQKLFELYELSPQLSENDIADTDESNSFLSEIEEESKWYHQIVNMHESGEDEKYHLPFVFKQRDFEDEVDRITTTDEDDIIPTTKTKPSKLYLSTSLFEIEPLVQSRSSVMNDSTKVVVKTSFTASSSERLYKQIFKDLARAIKKLNNMDNYLHECAY